MVYPCVLFNSIDDYQEPVNNFEKVDLFIYLINASPSDGKIKRTKEIIRQFNSKNGDELTKLYLKSYVILLADIFEKLIKACIDEFDINPLYCVNLTC